MVFYMFLVIAMLACAVFAMRATRLLSSALWLAGVSVFTAIILYRVGATMMAVIELSLSVGLITILLVFAISTAGANSPDHPAPQRLNVLLPVLAIALIIGLALPIAIPQPPASDDSFATIFWHLREADVLVQIALIFAGVLGVLGLLAEPRLRSKGAAVELVDEARMETIQDLPALTTASEQPEREVV